MAIPHRTQIKGPRSAGIRDSGGSHCMVLHQTLSRVQAERSAGAGAFWRSRNATLTSNQRNIHEQSGLTYRSLFDVARQYRESFDVYGSKASVEWPLVEHEPLVLHRAKLAEPKIPKPVRAPDFAKRLPKPIQRFTTQGVYDLAKKTHLSFTQGAGHGGSHPHLAHEFLQALLEDRDPFPNALNQPIGPVWVCAPTSPPSKAAPSCACRSLPCKPATAAAPCGRGIAFKHSCGHAGLPVGHSPRSRWQRSDTPPA
jgi:hypothetical protein